MVIAIPNQEEQKAASVRAAFEAMLQWHSEKAYSNPYPHSCPV
jgi:hypothetical protein